MLEDILDYLYHEHLYNGNIKLQDDGQGSYIKLWQVPGVKQPTSQELAQYSEDALLKKENNPPILDKLIEIDFQSIRALRENDVDKLQELNNQAEELRSQLI